MSNPLIQVPPRLVWKELGIVQFVAKSHGEFFAGLQTKAVVLMRMK